jgi:alanine-glyoxylate transaminase / serine-glyoxylate transaminase / serine-pyruvate transaminase
MVKELDLPVRILMGPGPSTVHPRVLKAISMPLLGHLDPKFLDIMNETTLLLQGVFETEKPNHGYAGYRKRRYGSGIC